MKQRLIYITVLLCSLMACSKDDTEQEFYATPEKRMSDSLSFISKALVEAPFGWKGGFATGAKGGYGFYFEFKPNQEVGMLSDFTTATGTTLSTSTYRVTALSVPTLVFDTYNYISLMQDPVPEVAGGKAGEGFKSDIEFLYQRSNKDTLFFKGKKYSLPFMLVKASKTEKDAYLAAGVNTFKQQIISNYNNNFAFPYIENSTAKLNFSVDNAGKAVSFNYINSKGNIDSAVSTSFYFTTSELQLVKFIPFNNKLVKSFVLKENKFVLVYSDGTEGTISNQSTPLFSVESSFAYNKAYKKIVSGDPIPGVTADVHIFDKVKELFTASTRTITEMYFGFNNSTTAIFYIAYTSGTSKFVASATYEYRREGNKIFLKRVSIDGGNNWTTRATQVAPVNDLFGNGDERAFDIDWVSSSNNSVKYPIIGIKSSANPNKLLYGKLGE